MSKPKYDRQDREPKIHKVKKGTGSRIDKHRKLIYTLASSYKKDDFDDMFDANLDYDTHFKQR
jgi:hypothetical protein